MSEYCNDYSATIGEKLYNKLKSEDPTLPDARFRPEEQLKLLIDNGKVDVAIENIPLVDYSQMEKLVNGISPDKSSGLDGISARVLKDAFQVLILQLCAMFNNSIRQGIFPEAWAKASVVPIPKSGPLTQVVNWRPVSLLPTPGKMIERVLHDHITNLANQQGLITPKQYGFVKGKGTNDAVFDLISKLYENRDKAEATCVCYVDFSKAFDSIHHSLLIKKLSDLGMNGTLLKWLTSYLQNRKQSTLLNNHKTGHKEVLFGVPQGSILGPLLFILYVNGASNTARNCEMMLYADDIVLSVSHNDAEVANLLAQEDLNRLVAWCTNHGLTINAKKKQVVWYGPKDKIAQGKETSIKIRDTPLESPDEYKYLGVRLDSELKLDVQMSATEKSVGHKIFRLRRLRHQMDQETAIIVYKQTILPYFDYCSFIIDGAKKTKIKKLQTLQNNALRVCTQKYNREIYSTDEVHADCSVERLDQRRQFQLAILMYKKATLLGLRPVQNPRTRNDLKVKFKACRAKLQGYKKSPMARGIALWDRIKPVVQQAPSVAAFKRLYKKHPLDPPQITD